MSQAVNLTINTMTGCPHCVTAKDFCNVRGAPFDENVIDDKDERSALYEELRKICEELELRHAATMPRIVLSVDGQIVHVCGADGLKALWGVESLFGIQRIQVHQPAVSVAVEDTAGMVMAEEGHSCCE